ncbi:MAG TPA: CARDB domain-containing protein [Phycisphaerales bacterium]|nr:CARDB domain-containing protein [Phycisphaerales bacterium]
MTRIISRFVAALAGVTVLGLSACESVERPPAPHYQVDFREPERGPALPVTTVRQDAKPAAPAPAPTGACRPMVPSGWTSSSLAFPTGEERTSALLVTQVAPGQVRAGQAYEYMIVVCNLTSSELQNVVVRSENADNLNIASSAPAFGKGADGSVHWMVGNLKANESVTIKVNATASKVGQATNCISASYASVLCVGTQVVQPALALSMTIDADRLICDPLTARVEVRNPGSGAADGVRVTAKLPAGVTTADGRTDWSWDVGTLEGGATKNTTIALKATKTGKYDASASATASGGLTAESNKVSTSIKQPVLTVKAECGSQALMNRPVTCKFTVKNTGDAPSAGTMLTANVSPNTNFASADTGGTQNGGVVTWNLGTLAPGESKTVSMTGTTTGMGQITCGARARGVCASEVTDQCGSTVIGVPDIGTLVDDDTGVTTIGDPHTYRVEVMNQGQVPLTNVKTVCTLPAGMEFVSSPLGKLVNGKVEFSFGTIPPRERRTSTFVVKGTKTGELLVIGETTCSELKTPVRDDELTNFIDR